MAGYNIYTQADFYEIVDGMVHQKFSQVNDRQVISNRAVRFCLGEIDFRSTKRREALSPNLFDAVYQYTAPASLKGEKIIDLRKQVNRPSSEKWRLVDDADFDRLKGRGNERHVALRDEEASSLLRIDGTEGSKSVILHECNSLTTNGTWAATADASNLTVDTENYISGGSALNFDMAAGAATGYIENSTMTQVNLTDYDEIGSIFVWVFIPDYSDAEGDTVTNFILRWGNDSSNYWSRTVTTNNEGQTFYDGWNLLRFDWNGATETGTVAPATIDYLRLTVTKSTSLAADTDWRVDSFVARIGDIYDVIYYTKFGWQTVTTNAYVEESSATTDELFADTDEVEIVGFKAAEFASQELKEYDDVTYFRQEYANAKRKYQARNPSEALKKYSRYAAFPRINRW